jgi:hypothetical protein
MTDSFRCALICASSIVRATELTRIAIVNDDKCKPKNCRQECKKSCPVVRMGKLCIEADASYKVCALLPCFAWIQVETRLELRVFDRM